MNLENILQKKQYIDFKVYSVTTIKKGYGFRIVLIYDDGTEIKTQKSGFKTKKAANDARNLVITELNNGTFVINDKVNCENFFCYWLEKVMRPVITDDSYVAYKNVVYKYIVPKIGRNYLIALNNGKIRNLYKQVADKSHSVARICKCVVQTALGYALENNLVSYNAALNVQLPKEIKKKKYRTIEIDSKKTLNVNQVKILIEKAKDTPIHLQVMFAVLMGLRKQEINGLKYEDVDFIHRTLKISRQLGRKPNTDNSELKVGEYTKQEIDVKTFSSKRELDIPDIVFEAILEEKKKYERNRSKRINDKTTPFKDYGYICCSTYGNPRSKSFHFKYWKQLLKDCNLPNIRFHDLRASYSTLLIKYDFNLKAISKLMGHASEIITVDVYGDKEEIISDCVSEIEPFIERVKPKENVESDFSEDEDTITIMNDYIENLCIT